MDLRNKTITLWANCPDNMPKGLCTECGLVHKCKHMATDAELMQFRTDLIAHFTDRIMEMKKKDDFEDWDNGWNCALEEVIHLLNPKKPDDPT